MVRGHVVGATSWQCMVWPGVVGFKDATSIESLRDARAMTKGRVCIRGVTLICSANRMIELVNSSRPQLGTVDMRQHLFPAEPVQQARLYPKPCLNVSLRNTLVAQLHSVRDGSDVEEPSALDISPA